MGITPTQKMETKMTTKTTTTTPTNNEIDLILLSTTHTTKSAMIRHLHSEGMKTARIWKLLVEFYPPSKNGFPLKYQHVRNVITQAPKKA